MAIKTKAQLLIDINTIVTTNANNEITGALLNQLLIDINDSSANIDSDSGILGLTEHSQIRNYGVKHCVVFESNIFISNEPISAGAFDPNDWTLLTKKSDPVTDFGFVPFDNLATYNVGDRVEYQNELFKCDVNGTIGVIPIDSAPEWIEVSASSGIFGDIYEIETYYKTGDVVTFTDNKLYIKTIQTSPFYSLDFLTEKTANEWLLFHDISGGGVSTLSDVLGAGNESGLNDILMTFEQFIEFKGSPAYVNGKIRQIGAPTKELQLSDGFTTLRIMPSVAGDIAVYFGSTGGTGFFLINGTNQLWFSNGVGSTYIDDLGNVHLTPPGSKNVIIDDGGIQFDGLHKIFRFKAYSVGDKFINLTTGNGVLNEHANSYNISFPAKPVGNYKFAFTSDLPSPTPILTMSARGQSNVLSISPPLGISTIATLNIPVAGDYIVEWTATIQNIGAIDCEFSMLETYFLGGSGSDANNNSLETKPQIGGGAGVQQRGVISKKSTKRSFLISDTIAIRINVLVGTPTLTTFVAHLIKVN